MWNSIKYYKGYTISYNFLIFVPVLVSIYIERGITTSQILFLESIYCITILLFEIPTGLLGDRLGHVKLVVIGLLGTIASYLVLAFASTIYILILSQILLGIFSTCTSGSDLASLSFDLEKSNSITVYKSIHVVETASMLVAYIASSFAIKYNPKGTFVFLIMAFSNLCALVFFLKFVKKKKIMSDSLEKIYNSKSEKGITIQDGNSISITDLLNCGIMFGIISTTYLISQIFYNNLEIDRKYMGAIYCISSILIIIFTKSKYAFNNITMFILPLLFIIPIFSYKIMIIPYILLLSWAKAKVFPFVNNYIIQNTETHKALNLSVSNMVNNGINAILMFTLSGVVYKLGFTSALVMLAIVSAFLLWGIYQICSNELKSSISQK